MESATVLSFVSGCGMCEIRWVIGCGFFAFSVSISVKIFGYALTLRNRLSPT